MSEQAARLREPAEFDEKRLPGEPSFVPPTRITLLYESRDGRLCLFEDARGHLFAVRAALLV